MDRHTFGPELIQSWNSEKKLWQASMLFAGNSDNVLGHFDDEMDAALAHDQMAQKLGRPVNFERHSFGTIGAGMNGLNESIPPLICLSKRDAKGQLEDDSTSRTKRARTDTANGSAHVVSVVVVPASGADAPPGLLLHRPVAMHCARRHSSQAGISCGCELEFARSRGPLRQRSQDPQR